MVKSRPAYSSYEVVTVFINYPLNIFVDLWFIDCSLSCISVFGSLWLNVLIIFFLSLYLWLDLFLWCLVVPRFRRGNIIFLDVKQNSWRLHLFFFFLPRGLVLPVVVIIYFVILIAALHASMAHGSEFQVVDDVFSQLVCLLLLCFDLITVIKREWHTVTCFLELLFLRTLLLELLLYHHQISLLIKQSLMLNLVNLSTLVVY